jgi:type 1 glutamine amidotransferase
MHAAVEDDLVSLAPRSACRRQSREGRGMRHAMAPAPEVVFDAAGGSTSRSPVNVETRCGTLPAESERGDKMTETNSGRAHLVAGGFPPGSSAGHDHDHARLRLLELLAEQNVQASVANDFADVEKWLPIARLLITYVAGPYPDAAQSRAIQHWMEAGGHWLALHGTSGGRAERVEGMRQRRTVKTEHHAVLGSYFLTHPPIRRFRVDVSPEGGPLTRGLGTSFDVEDEPYFIELQDPASTRILLTADYGPEATPAGIGRLYGADTSLLPDGRTRVLGYTRDAGAGGVTYLALGHCHSPASRSARAAESTDTTPSSFRGSWESDAFITLLRNAIAWGVSPRS